MKLYALLILVSYGAHVLAQFGDGDSGPLPPRIQIPGAVPVGGRPPFRRQRILAPVGKPVPLPPLDGVRARGPLPGRAIRPLPAEPSFANNVIPASPSPPPPPPPPSPSPISFAFPPQFDSVSSSVAPPIPPAVQESPEEDDYDLDDALIQPIPSSRPAVVASRPLNIQPAIFRPTRPVFKPTSAPPADINIEARQQSRTSRPPAPSSTARPLPQESDFGGTTRGSPRPAYRPSPAPPQQAPARPQQPQPYVRPNGRPKKPVAQIINRYREDNADGSITWGFENDDGTFKEETIGVDCTVRGKYGYVDPDGQRREYAYTSGIPCDKDKRNQEVGGDYQDNKYVLPNGDALDLDTLVKNKARRPVQNFRT